MKGAPHTAPSAGPDSSPGADLDELLRSCIHCGLCLSSCPTYRASGDEAESPRGRLMVIGEITGLGSAYPIEGVERLEVGPEVARVHLDRCLGCRHCESVCPSGVAYGYLLEMGRESLGPEPSRRARWLRALVDRVLSRPARLYPMARVGVALRRLGLASLVPGMPGSVLRSLLSSLPSRRLAPPGRHGLPASGNVAILPGCAQQVFSPDVLPASARLIAAAGAEPFVPEGADCCGAMSHHAGSVEEARAMARRLIAALEGCDAVVVPSAGCSAHIGEYAELFANEPEWADRARRIASITEDLLVWLSRHPERLRFRAHAGRVVYHPPCHHSHAQGIRGLAEGLLAKVPELEQVPLLDPERCCGSAGAYSLLQPEMARSVRSEKLDRIESAQPDLLLSANPGCELFLERGLEERGRPLRARHVVSFLARLVLDDGPLALQEHDEPRPRADA